MCLSQQEKTQGRLAPIAQKNTTTNATKCKSVVGAVNNATKDK